MSAYSREHVFHLLAEAAELEHNILCSYLYAAFSLKRSTAEGLSTQQLEVVNRWRSELMQVCVEEMVHLAQISNLLLAVGARPHLNRPNLPPPPGYHPAGIVIRLAPFSLETVEHFLFLERPEQASLADTQSPAEDTPARRPTVADSLMPWAPDWPPWRMHHECTAPRQCVRESQ